MAEINPGEYVSFVRQGGIPVRIVRYDGIYVRVIRYGGKPVTFVSYGGTPVIVDRDANLPEDVQEQIGY